MLAWIITLVAMFVTDICWTFYILQVKEGSALHSAKWSVFLFLTGAIGTISYVKDPWLLIPATIGVFLGTYAAVWWDNKRKKNDEKNNGTADDSKAATNI